LPDEVRGYPPPQWPANQGRHRCPGATTGMSGVGADRTSRPQTGQTPAVHWGRYSTTGNFVSGNDPLRRAYHCLIDFL